MQEINHDWPKFYMEFADILLTYKNNRKSIIDKIQKIHYDLGINLLKLEEDDLGNEFLSEDIDPFTVFALFNRNLMDENRISIIKSLKNEFSIKSDIPTSFKGIPILDSRYVRFYGFKNKRGIDDINNLWNLFENAINYSKNISILEKFIYYYDLCVNQKEIGWKITIALFWIRPFDFISLDGNNRSFLTQDSIFSNILNNKNLNKVPKGEEYIDICSKCKHILNNNSKYKNFIDISFAAYDSNRKQEIYIDKYFRKILNVYPEKIEKTSEEEKLQKWLNTKFLPELNYFLLNNYCINSNYKIIFNSDSKRNLQKNFIITLKNEEFFDNYYNEFQVYILFNHRINEVDFGLKINMASDFTLSSRINFLSKNIKNTEFYSKNNRIILKKIKYDKLNNENIKNNFMDILNIYENLIPKYINFLKNENHRFTYSREENKNKCWVLNLDNIQSNKILWDEFIENSYVTTSFIYENNDCDYSQFINRYELDLYFSHNISKDDIEDIWMFINIIEKNDFIILCENNYIKGIGVIYSGYKSISDDNLINNCYKVKWVANLNHLSIEYFNNNSFYEITSDKWNRLVLLLSRYNEKLLDKIINYIANLLDEFNHEKLNLYEIYDEKEHYVIETWNVLLNDKKNGEDISEDIWEKLINWCYGNDVKSIIQKNNNFSNGEMEKIASLYFNSIIKLIKTYDINEQILIIENFLEFNNYKKLKYDLGNHLVMVLHYLKKDFIFWDKHIIKTLNLLSLLFGYELKFDKNLKNYPKFNYEFNYFLEFINNNKFFKRFSINEFREFFVFSHLLCDKNLGNFYSNNPNSIPYNVIRNNGSYDLLRFNSVLDLNKTVLKFELGNFAIPDTTVYRICASLNSGKHIILEGTPGTGKTDLAIKFSNSSEKNRFIDGYILTTATSDWSTFDTIGGLMQDNDGSLEFHQGIFLEAISENKWLIIDEINRADIDKAFGPLFTVLAGQNVELPYKINGQTIKIKNSDKLFSQFDSKTSTYYIGKNWRIIGTMNIADKDSLFDLSYAFMRRFMFIDVDIPQKEEYVRLISDWTKGLNEYYTENLINLLGLIEYRKIGPAIFKDMAEYINYRYKLDDSNSKLILSEAISSYIIPQLEGLSKEKINDIKLFFKELNILEYLDIQLDSLLPVY